MVHKDHSMLVESSSSSGGEKEGKEESSDSEDEKVEMAKAFARLTAIQKEAAEVTATLDKIRLDKTKKGK